MHDASVGTQRNIHARLLQILLARCSHLDHGAGLPAPDALRLAGDADRPASDAHLHKVGAGIGQEAESVTVHDVARAHLYRIAVLAADPVERIRLPLRKPFGRVDAQNIGAGTDQFRNTLLVIARIDARAHDVALLLVQKLHRIRLVRVVVLAKHEILKPPAVVENRQRVELVVPQDVVGRREGHALARDDQLVERRHKLRHLRVQRHAADPVVATRHQTDHFAFGRPVVGDRRRRVTRPLFERQDVGERLIGADVRVRSYEARFVAFDFRHHRGFVFDALRAVDKGRAAFARKRYAEAVAGDRLHDRRDEGNVEAERRLFADAEFCDRRLQADVVRRAVFVGIRGYQQVLAKRSGRLFVIQCHGVPPCSDNRLLPIVAL